MTSNHSRIAVIGLGQIGGSTASDLGTAGGDRRRDDGAVVASRLSDLRDMRRLIVSEGTP
jgi:prephenate dehydrogenase